MKRCENCLNPIKDPDPMCGSCGEQAPPQPDRARLMSVVVDAVLKELNLAGQVAPDEDARLVAVEILVALKQSSAYSEWSRQLTKLELTSAISSAVHLGWSLREAVESNWWDSLPRASDPGFTKALRELAREIYRVR